MRKVKAIIYLGLFCLLFSLVGAATVSYTTPIVDVTMVSQDPEPVEPGQVVKVKFKIENSAKETSEDVIVKLREKYPFTVYDGQSEKNIGKLTATSTGNNAIYAEFKIKVDEKATEGETELELELQIGEGAFVYDENEFLIDIQTHDAVLEIVAIESVPKQIAHGGTSKIKILVKNLADSLLKDIKFKLDLSSDDLPLAPYQSSSERRISQLNTNHQQALTFDLIAEPDATSGLFKVPLNITYNDEKGTSYSIDDILAVKIGNIPKLNMYIKKSEVTQSGKAGKITLEIANPGTTKVKFLELTILPSKEFKLVSTNNYYYIGDVDSDDTESEELVIYIEDEIERKLILPVKLTYQDANNKEYQQTFNLQMDIYTSSEMKKYGLTQPNYNWIYFILILIIIGGYIFYYKYYKKKKK